MIQKNIRGGELYSEYDLSPKEAANYLVKFEFKFGGKVVFNNNTKIEVETEMPTRLDRTIMLGNSEELIEMKYHLSKKGVNLK